MKKLLLAITASAALAVPLIATTAAPADASVRQYVSRTEFGSIHHGMSMYRVHQIFGDYGKLYRGSQTSYYDEIDADYCAQGETWACAEQDREYHTKSVWGYVDVDFYRSAGGTWRVESKHAYWG